LRDDGESWTEESLLDVVLEVGGDDLIADGDQFVVLSAVQAFAEVNDALTQALAGHGSKVREAGLASIPTQRTAVTDVAIASRLVRLIDALEDNEDVQEVFSNEDFSDDVLSQLEV
jgi:transcriptional/translational regulatory protein YebC/TACO1